MINNKYTSLVLLGANFFNFIILLAVTLGSRHWGLIWIVVEIFYPIVGGLLLFILTPTILSHFFGKLKYVRLHKFMSFVDYGAIFGLMVATFVLATIDGFSGIGFMLIFLEMITAAATAVVSLIQFSNIQSTKDAQVQKRQMAENSTNAAQKLRTLKELHDKGVITEEEYNEKKKKYIDLL